MRQVFPDLCSAKVVVFRYFVVQKSTLLLQKREKRVGGKGMGEKYFLKKLLWLQKK
jgi:hypothetical protein